MVNARELFYAGWDNASERLAGLGYSRQSSVDIIHHHYFTPMRERVPCLLYDSLVVR